MVKNKNKQDPTVRCWRCGGKHKLKPTAIGIKKDHYAVIDGHSRGATVDMPLCRDCSFSLLGWMQARHFKRYKKNGYLYFEERDQMGKLFYRSRKELK
ncbi:MAG: hypothetical protein PHO00_01015 [bacterium]|nr:hypothetical protein [bacterium]